MSGYKYAFSAYLRNSDVNPWHARYDLDIDGAFNSFFFNRLGDGTAPQPGELGPNGPFTLLLAADETPLVVYRTGTAPELPLLYVEPIDFYQGGPMSTQVLEAEILSVGATADKNLLALTLPGKTTPTTRRFLAEHLEGLKVSAGDKVAVRLHLEPSERIVIERIGKPGSIEQPAPEPKPELPPLAKVVGPAPEELPQGVYYLEPDPLYVPPQDLVEYGHSIARVHRDGERVQGLVGGPVGGGKTAWVRHFAAEWGHPYAKVDCGLLNSVEDLLGHREFKGGETTYVPGLAVKALGTPNAILHLDEVNRTLPQYLYPLLPLLDSTGQVWSQYLERYVYVDPTVIVLGTANLGVDEAGTFRMPEALMTRLEYPVMVDYPQPADEAAIVARRARIAPKIAEALVAFAGEIRSMADSDRADALDRSISTRNLITVGHLVRTGMAPGHAIKHCILPRFSTEGGAGSQQQQVLKVLQGRFGS